MYIKKKNRTCENSVKIEGFIFQHEPNTLDHAKNVQVSFNSRIFVIIWLKHFFCCCSLPHPLSAAYESTDFRRFPLAREKGRKKKEKSPCK